VLFRSIEQTFDAFANSFENILGRLKYCGPQLVQDFLAVSDFSAASLNVLDLGCGTGLVGEVLKPYAWALTGVDLSQSMLDWAHSKQFYQHLHKSDIADYLRMSRDKFDLITIMDTFIYLGSLDEVIVLMHKRLNAGGMLLFSTERLLGGPDQAYQLNISGRYSHQQDYLIALLNNTGFKLREIRDVVIRTESGCPIEGQFFCAVRTE